MRLEGYCTSTLKLRRGWRNDYVHWFSGGERRPEPPIKLGVGARIEDVDCPFFRRDYCTNDRDPNSRSNRGRSYGNACRYRVLAIRKCVLIQILRGVSLGFANYV